MRISLLIFRLQKAFKVIVQKKLLVKMKNKIIRTTTGFHYAILFSAFCFSYFSTFSQKHSDPKYYLVDSMELEKISEPDVQLIDSCLKVFHSAKSDTAKILAINTIVETSWDDRVWVPYNEWVYGYVSEILPKTKNRKAKTTLQKYQAGSLSNIGFYHYQKGDSKPALEFYGKAIKIQKLLSDHAGLASSYNNIGLVYQMLGKIDDALVYFNKSLKIKHDLGDTEGTALAYNNLADIYSNQGNIPLALDYHHKSLKIKERTGNEKGMAESFVNIAMIHSRQKDYDLAIKYDQKALKIFKKIGDKQSVATVYSNFGSIYKSKGDNDKAFEYYQKSLVLDEELGNKIGMADTYNKISALYYSVGKMKESKEYILKSKTLSEETGYRKGIVISCQYLGRMHFEANEFPEAISYCTQGLELAQSLGYPDNIRSNAAILSMIYSRQGNFEKAFEMRNLEIKMRDSMANEEAYRSAAQQEAKYNYDKQFAQDSIKNAQEKKVRDARALQQDAELENRRNLQYAMIGGLIILIAFLAFVYNRFRVTHKQKNIIEKQKELVDDKNKEILDSIRYAKRIQEAILPSMKAMNDALKDGFVLYKPKDVVAGDFFWLEMQEDKIYFSAADCTGHGVPGAMVSVICSNALSRALLEEKAKSTGELLDKTRNIVIERLAKSGDEMKDGMDISVCALDLNKMKLQWSGANNPLWIARKENGKEEYSLLEFIPNKQPIGKYADSKPFASHEIDLLKGDIIYIFTDGYQDQFGGPKSKKFKASKMKELFLTIADEKMEDQKKIIDQKFMDWKGKLDQVDDVCIIGVRIGAEIKPD